MISVLIFNKHSYSHSVLHSYVWRSCTNSLCGHHGHLYLLGPHPHSGTSPETQSAAGREVQGKEPGSQGRPGAFLPGPRGCPWPTAAGGNSLTFESLYAHSWPLHPGRAKNPILSETSAKLLYKGPPAPHAPALPGPPPLHALTLSCGVFNRV